MDGVYVQCPSTHPETGIQCVRLANTHDEHVGRRRDGSIDYDMRWTDKE